MAMATGHCTTHAGYSSIGQHNHLPALTTAGSLRLASVQVKVTRSHPSHTLVST
ncbi:hypothetical protein BC629DRAFT_1529922 [Irpex lacteus]|nr:hypothetical protein BC629DRAFT_1529922 [Irpex lacteus]